MKKFVQQYFQVQLYWQNLEKRLLWFIEEYEGVVGGTRSCAELVPKDSFTTVIQYIVPKD